MSRTRNHIREWNIGIENKAYCLRPQIKKEEDYANILRLASSQKPTYLKLMLKVTKNLIELLGLQSIKESQDEAERMERLKQELPVLEKLLKMRN